MQLNVVACWCGHPKTHRKFKDEAGKESDGIFSLAQGRCFLKSLKAHRQLTEADYAKAEAALVVAGLPEFVSFTDVELQTLAERIVKKVPLWARELGITQNIQRGMISCEDADRLRAILHEHSIPALQN